MNKTGMSIFYSSFQIFLVILCVFFFFFFFLFVCLLFFFCFFFQITRDKMFKYKSNMSEIDIF